MAEPEILKVRDDGTAVGELDGVLFLGKPRKVGWDELTIKTKLSKDGQSLERTALAGSLVVGSEYLTKDVFIEGRVERGLDMTRNEVEAGKMTQKQAKEAAQAYAKAQWDLACSSAPHAPVSRDVLDVDGNIVSVDMKITTYDWTEVSSSPAS